LWSFDAIALIAKVSTSAVSKIINNKDKDIGDETRKKVLQTIAYYQYVPYSKLRTSVGIKTNLIGLIISEGSNGAADLILYVEQAAVEHGYSIVLCNVNKDNLEKYLKVLVSKQVDGIVFYSHDYAIGHLGDDDYGKELYGNLVKNSVKTDAILSDSTNFTGKAYINVSEKGESSIVVYPGANKLLDTDQVERFSYLFSDAEYCLLSMEISKEVIEYSVNVCKKNNVHDNYPNNP
jgi:DNA-binding LacI/PurR family transcriptional regulator